MTQGPSHVAPQAVKQVSSSSGRPLELGDTRAYHAQGLSENPSLGHGSHPSYTESTFLQGSNSRQLAHLRPESSVSISPSSAPGSTVVAPQAPRARSSSFQMVPFFSKSGKASQSPDLMAQPTKLSQPSNIRPCGGQSCRALLTEAYPHLRCRRCRMNNVPRRPELKGILTAAQFAQMHNVPRQLSPRSMEPIPPSSLSTSLPRSALAPGSPPVHSLPQSVVGGYLPRGPQSHPQIYLPFQQRLPSTSLDAGKISSEPKSLVSGHEKEPEDSDSSNEDLEFMYPEPDETGTVALVETTTTVPSPPPPDTPFSAGTSNAVQGSKISREPSLKRRKVSHPMPTPDFPPVTEKPFLPADKAHMPSVPASLMIGVPTDQTCSSDGCKNRLDAAPASLGPRRCPSCILSDWKSKKARAANVATNRKSRTVSWAPSVLYPVKREDAMDVDASVADGAASTIHALEGNSKPQPVNVLATPEAKRPSLKIKLNLSKVKLPPATTTTPGWDSDLSDINDSSASDEDGSNNQSKGSNASATIRDDSDSEEGTPLALATQPQRSGFKIRIPASAPRPSSSSVSESSPISTAITRPPSLEAARILAEGGRWCANYARCRQVLHRNYTWKSCILCRAKTRNYQRQRQNLQTSHKALDQELATFTALQGTPKSCAPTPGVKLEYTSPPPDLFAASAASSSSSAQPKSLLISIPAVAVAPSTSSEVEDFKGAPLDLSDLHLTGVPEQAVPGARPCSAKMCSHILPSSEEYHRRMCFGCQRRCKDARRRARQLRKGEVEDEPYDYAPWVECLDDVHKLSSGRCKSIDCGMLVHTKVTFAYCHQCRVRATRAIKKGMKKEGKNYRDIRNFMQEVTTQEVRVQLGMAAPKLSIRLPSLQQAQSKPKLQPESPYPRYKCLSALLENMQRLSRDFFEAQTWYSVSKCQATPAASEKEEGIEVAVGKEPRPDLKSDKKVEGSTDSKSEKVRQKTGSGAEQGDVNSPETKKTAPPEEEKMEKTDKPETIDGKDSCISTEDAATSNLPVPLTSALFCFDGEYSVVAPDYDVASRRAHVDELVDVIKDEAQNSAGIMFGSKRWISIFDYGISTRLICARECTLLEPSKTPGSKPQKVTKLMQGELEVAVVMDKSHPFVPGERTVVRLRLIG